MEGRPPEVTDSGNGETLKLACMACIRGHRTKHCGSLACRDKILWTIKRPGRPSNSCMCKFSGTGRCKCVIAKAQCPHKAKKGEKKTTDCRCDERGRLCCTLSGEQWQMLANGTKPNVRLYRTQEELHASFMGGGVSADYMRVEPLPPGQSPMSTPQTPAASMGGFTNGSGGNTPQTPISMLHNPGAFAQQQLQSLPQSPAGPPRARFGMMGIGAPMGSEGHVGQDVLSWQGQTPIAPAPRPAYEPPPTYSRPPSHVQPPYPALFDSPFPTMPYTFDNSISQPPLFSPHHQEAQPLNLPQTPLYQSQSMQSPGQHTFDAVPPVTTSLGDLSVAPNETLPALSGFDMDYFNFQFPGAICQQCGMANCTCRSCPTVLQSTMDGSWKQCCSRKHAFSGAAPAAQGPAKSCCGSKVAAPANVQTFVQPSSTAPVAANAADTRSAGGCCAGSRTQDDLAIDPFDFSTEAQVAGQSALHISSPPPGTPASHIPSYPGEPGIESLLFDPGALPPETHSPQSPQPPYQAFAATKGPAQVPHKPFYVAANANPELEFQQDPLPEWDDPGDIDMDFDEFIQEQGGCGCGTECPCGMDDSLDMELDAALKGNAEGGEAETPSKGGCCGGGGGG